MIQNFTCSIHRGFKTRKASTATYRFLSNKRVKEEDLVQRLLESTRKRVGRKRLLVLSDTTEYNLSNHKGRITDFEGVGSTSRNDTLGFFSHNQLVLDRQTHQTLGWAHVNLFNRPVNNQAYVRPNSSVAITKKESNKWYEPSLYSRDKVLNQATHCLYVMDREADIYEVISMLPNESCDILVRARHNRMLNNDKGERLKLKVAIDQEALKGIVLLKVNGESRKRAKRTAKCELKYKRFKIPRPKRIYDKYNYPEKIEATIVQIEEVSQTAKGETPIKWTLWTSEDIQNNKQALEILDCYTSRWSIEEAHRLLKIKGFNIESTELESGKSIRKLLILGMEASIKVMQLKAARSGTTQEKTEEVFEKEEIEFLEILNQTLQGATKLLSNPYPKNNLAWASWIVARLGGWKGYDSQRPPGTITFKRGLDSFNKQLAGFLLAKEFKRSV